MNRKPFTIFIIDGDPAKLQLHSAILRSHGYSVLETTTGRDCLRLALKRSPNVILVGDTLPDINSIELCRRLKTAADTSHILTVLITQLNSAVSAKESEDYIYVDGYLISPVTENELISCMLTMERIHQGDVYVRAPKISLEQNTQRENEELDKSPKELKDKSVSYGPNNNGGKSKDIFFKEVTENSTDIILIVDQKGIVTYASPSVERILGYKPEDIVGKSTFKFIKRADLPRALYDFGKATLKDEVAIPNSFKVMHKDGTERILEGLGRNLLHNPTISGFIMNVYDVTERRRIEETKRLFAYALESISEIITITDFEDRFTFINQAFLKTYGYKKEEVLGKHVGMLWSPNNPEGLLKEILETNRTKNWTGELLNVTKDGREFPISLHTSRIKNEKGKTVGLIGISEDITEQKKIKETLKESEAQYRDMVEQIDEVIFATTMKGVVTYISPTVEHLSGYKPEEIVHHSMDEFIDPIFAPLLYEQYNGASFNTLKPIEYRIIIKSGERRWVRSSSRLKLENGIPEGMRGVLIDITAEKNARESMNLLSHTVKSINEAVCITDYRNIILFVNQAFLSTYGYSEEEVIGKPISVVNPNFEMVDNVLEKTLEGGWQGELVNRKKDGTEFPIFLSTSVVLDERGNAIALVGVTTDITERKKIEFELNFQKSQLQKSYDHLSRLELAQNTLMHMVVHDMRSRLFVLLMAMEVLKNYELKNITEKNREVLDQAISTTKILTQMVNSLLDISKMESGELKLKLSECNLAKITRDTVKEHEIQRGGRRFIVNAPEDSDLTTCDAKLISRVIQNLFSNAIKYTSGDGFILINIENTGNEKKISIQDSGLGIAPHHLSKIFDKFYQADALPNSTGIGLTFCKLAVELHGGKIGVESEIGNGSTFWFTLPKQRI